MSPSCPPNGKQVVVEVDQRALVDMLARYPGQFDVLRELIQNADDAVSPIVELHFETGSRPAGGVRDMTKLVRKWIIKNEGSFKSGDWHRLGRIAAGNKDSTKVGAFGVGFYSVLSKSDRPLVKSGGKSLQFYRADDGKLCKKDGPLQVDDGWTSIELELKEHEALPALDDLARFLISSVALLTNIHTVSVHLDGESLLRVEKKSSDPPVNVSIPGHLTRTSPQQALRVDSVQHTVQTIAIEVAEWAFSSYSTPPSPPDDAGDALIARGTHDVQDDLPPTPTAPVRENEITHDLYTATTSVILDQGSEIRKGVESSLKSLPPSFECKGVYFNSEQHKTFTRISKSPLSNAHLFMSIVPEDNNGRLFVGQSTNQTTGIGLHFSSHFLPTMERGAIDLANGHIAAWNEEVLWVSGFLARVIYEEDMRFAESKSEKAMKLGLETMSRFPFGPTAPHSGVSQLLQDAFFSCASTPKSLFPVVSDIGICSASDPQFRQANNELSFLKMYPVLHPDVQPRQQSEITKRYGIPRIRYQDIANEFATGATPEMMKLFFAWWQGNKKSAFSPGADDKTKVAAHAFCKQFTSLGVLRSSKGVNIPLKTIKYFTAFPIDDDLSHPKSIYIDISSGVPTRDAIKCFGWIPLSLLDWLKHASSKAREITRKGDPDVGRRISRVIIQFSLSPEVALAPWMEVAHLVEEIKCIPTNKGLRLPSESYFEAADICRQLPVAKVTDFVNDIQGTYVMDRGYQPVTHDHVMQVLAMLGVRGMVEWTDLVARLETSASEATNDQLLQILQYLYSLDNRNVLPPQQLIDLRTRKMFYSQDHGPQPTTQLYLPDNDIRKLGLPILALPQNGVIYPALNSFEPATSSAMKQFLEYLGIKSYPSLDTVIRSAASDDEQIHEAALDYFLKHFEKQYEDYNADKFAHVAFIPTKCGSRACLNEVFTSSGWGKLKFKQASEKLRPRDASKLGIKENPPIGTIIEYFQIPHQTLPNYDIAKLWFEHLSSHGKFSTLELRDRLSTICFVPVKNPGSSSEISTTDHSYYPPKDCFIVSSDSKKHHHDIFPFVDFEQTGNGFLESCCAKKSPDATDIARKMAEDPQKYLKDLGGDTKLYTEDLRTIALQFDSIPEDTKDAMRKAPMFLGLHADASKLLPANGVVVGDWESRDFGGHVFLAPEEEVIKKMYHKMGSPFLKAYVRYDMEYSDSQAKCRAALTRDQITRGVKCFISRQRHDQCKTTNVLFDGQEVKGDFGVKVCKSLKMTKSFTPPPGVLADEVDVGGPKLVSESAGFEPKESTLWLAEGSSQQTHPHYDVAVVLCSVLLDTFSSDDVMLLASLISMDDVEFRRIYPEKQDKVPSAQAPTKKQAKRQKNVEIHLHLPWYVAFIAKRFGARLGSRPSHLHTIAPEDDVQNAVAMCSRPDSGGECYDFSKACGPYRTTFKKSNSHCKEAHKIKLIEKGNPKRQLRFFLAHDAHRHEPPGAALEEFSALIIELAAVFQLPVTSACYVFWADTNDDLMAFNRDQKFLFFNLFHYHKFFFDSKLPVEKKTAVTEWFLIMAHEIAHNRSQDHDEYHGSLTSRLVLTYLPALQEKYPWLAEDSQGVISAPCHHN